MKNRGAAIKDATAEPRPKRERRTMSIGDWGLAIGRRVRGIELPGYSRVSLRERES